MERYAINPTSGKLHKQGCRYIREAFISQENQNLAELLAVYHKSLVCCKSCLKLGKEAQELVQKHNSQFMWEPKQKKG